MQLRELNSINSKVKLAAHGPDMACAGHAHPSSVKAKNITLCHDLTGNVIEFGTLALSDVSLSITKQLAFIFWNRNQVSPNETE